MKKAPVVVGNAVLPESIPECNLGEPTASALSQRMKGGGGDTPYSEHQLAVAKETARKFGLMIKVRFVCGSCVLEIFIRAASLVCSILVTMEYIAHSIFDPATRAHVHAGLGRRQFGMLLET